VKQEQAEQEQTERERQLAITQHEWSDEERERYASMKPTICDDEAGEAGEAADDGLGDD